MPPKKAPPGSHVMPDGSIMKDSDMKKKPAAKKAVPKKPAKKPVAKSNWMSHVKKTFEAGKKKNDKYTYKQAMADAGKTYKK